MAEVTNELIYEVLKGIQARLGNIEESIREMRGEIRALRAQMNAMQMDISNLYEASVAHESRLARIERRLEIIDTPTTA